MKVILILFLILFVIVSSLFLTTFISRLTKSPQDMELVAEIPLEDESISIISDIKPDTAPDIQGLEEPVQEDAGTEAAQTAEKVEDILETREPEEEQAAATDETAEDEDTGEVQDEEDPGQETVKIYFDGDMENGIYLGAASYGLQSSRAGELFGSDLSQTGFRFEWQNTDLDLEPGSTHFVYIYFYNSESGWDYLRKEINITGQKPGNTGIKIFIDEPTEQKTIEVLERVRGWALDTASTDNTGIGKVKAYLDGPRDFGIELGDVDYGIPRAGVVDFFNNQAYLYSGYNLSTEYTGLEPGSKHTLFIYAESSSNPNKYNFEKTDIYISGERDKKAVIEATIDMPSLVSNNTLLIEGYAIEKGKVEDFLQKQQEESTNEEKSSSTTIADNSNISTDGYILKRIVFMSNQDGNNNIFSMNLDGSDRKRLTNHGGSDQYPEVSPDGMKIAYTSDINGVWQIVVMDWDGSNKRQLTHNSFRCAYPTWSHDMKYIYFEASIDGDWELFRINSDGSGQKRLTYNKGGHDWHPSAHPFDNKIIFESGMTGHDNIYIMNHDGSSISRLFNNNDRRRVPDISHDATMLAYTKYFGNNCEIHYTNLKDLNEIRISYNNDLDGHPSFSPDDRLIAYEERSGGQENIIIYDISTGQKTNITNSPYFDTDPSFMYQK